MCPVWTRRDDGLVEVRPFELRDVRHRPQLAASDDSSRTGRSSACRLWSRVGMKYRRQRRPEGSASWRQAAPSCLRYSYECDSLDAALAPWSGLLLPGSRLSSIEVVYRCRVLAVRNVCRSACTKACHVPLAVLPRRVGDGVRCDKPPFRTESSCTRRLRRGSVGRRPHRASRPCQ